MSCGRPKRDLELIHIVDQALSNAGQRAGDWLVCRPGCAQCCIGAFAINQLDAARLRDGIHHLRQLDSGRAEQVSRRATAYVERIQYDFPGDVISGLIDGDAEKDGRFDSFANHEICPALDPETGTCDLYQFRPMTCRVFGPPVRNEDGNLSVCELCFHGASNDQIAACELHPDPNHLEDELTAELQRAGKTGNTIVAFVLAE